MYSYADRLRAAELYIRLRKRLNATIRQLGYPAKNALRGWYREYLQHLDLRPQPMARAPKYSEAERQAALEHFRTHEPRRILLGRAENGTAPRIQARLTNRVFPQ